MEHKQWCCRWERLFTIRCFFVFNMNCDLKFRAARMSYGLPLAGRFISIAFGGRFSINRTGVHHFAKERGNMKSTFIACGVEALDVFDEGCFVVANIIRLPVANAIALCDFDFHRFDLPEDFQNVYWPLHSIAFPHHRTPQQFYSSGTRSNYNQHTTSRSRLEAVRRPICGRTAGRRLWRRKPREKQCQNCQAQPNLLDWKSFKGNIVVGSGNVVGCEHPEHRNPWSTVKRGKVIALKQRLKTQVNNTRSTANVNFICAAYFHRKVCAIRPIQYVNALPVVKPSWPHASAKAR